MTRSMAFYSITLATFLFGCSSGGETATSTEGGTQGSGGGGGGGGGSGVIDDLDMTELDFECIKSWTQVRKFWITNKLDYLEETLAVAEAPEGKVYPVGTVIQLVPTEAMVKRAPGFSAETKDWEFFFLEVTDKKTTIKARGTKDVVNGFGGNCLNCHAKAEPKWDLICEEGHGCDPLPITAEQIKMAQDADTRCAP